MKIPPVRTVGRVTSHSIQLPAREHWVVEIDVSAEFLLQLLLLG
jgi:hypothetical protein